MDDDILLIKLISGDELITRLEKDDKENINTALKNIANKNLLANILWLSIKVIPSCTFIYAYKNK